jgi:hypothetical protein
VVELVETTFFYRLGQSVFDELNHRERLAYSLNLTPSANCQMRIFAYALFFSALAELYFLPFSVKPYKLNVLLTTHLMCSMLLRYNFAQLLPKGQRFARSISL